MKRHGFFFAILLTLVMPQPAHGLEPNFVVDLWTEIPDRPGQTFKWGPPSIANGRIVFANYEFDSQIGHIAAGVYQWQSNRFASVYPTTENVNIYTVSVGHDGTISFLVRTNGVAGSAAVMEWSNGALHVIAKVGDAIPGSLAKISYLDAPKRVGGATIFFVRAANAQPDGDYYYAILSWDGVTLTNLVNSDSFFAATNVRWKSALGNPGSDGQVIGFHVNGRDLYVYSDGQFRNIASFNASIPDHPELSPLYSGTDRDPVISGGKVLFRGLQDDLSDINCLIEYVAVGTNKGTYNVIAKTGDTLPDGLKVAYIGHSSAYGQYGYGPGGAIYFEATFELPEGRGVGIFKYKDGVITKEIAGQITHGDTIAGRPLHSATLYSVDASGYVLGAYFAWDDLIGREAGPSGLYTSAPGAKLNEGATVTIERTAAGARVDWAGLGRLQRSNNFSTWADLLSKPGEIPQGTGSVREFFRVYVP